ncbi:MAG: IS630 family transposase [Planctomycetaceae bacterium]|nr:IS630 family transposase [Planctomycetaceae bacterium]
MYTRPKDPKRPLVCRHECPKQLIGETRTPLPAEPGSPVRFDTEYVRNGTCELFMFVAPLAGWRRVDVTEHRKRTDWAEQIKRLADEDFPDAEKIVLVMDNLNTHSIASLYETFPPEEARRIRNRLEIHYTPKHGSWLDMAEIELNVMTRQCLSRRINTITRLRHELLAWESKRNSGNARINWHFSIGDARERLASLYPKFEIPEA